MESDGKRIDPVPAKSRRQVLRPGVRIVAEQFAPYSDEPDELDFPTFAASVKAMGRAIGKSAHIDMERAIRGMSLIFSAIDEIAEAEAKAPRELDIRLEENYHINPTSITRKKARNDGRVKLPPTAEPGYVKLTKKKRR